jgi:hypothetical protein
MLVIAYNLERAARYRQANRKAVSQRQQEYIKRKLAEDPTYRVRMICQIHWKARCRRKRVYHSKGSLELLGMPWKPLCHWKRCDRSYSASSLLLLKNSPHG